MSAVRPGDRQRRGRPTAAPAIPLPTPTLARPLRELSAVVERLVQELASHLRLSKILLNRR